MPLGGINAGFDETVPADSENAGLGAQRIRSLETAVQQILDSEHNFPASGGANTGYHRLGSARPFYGLQSTVSSSGSDGRLMVTSNTSKLFHVGSGGTMLLGSRTGISHADTTPPSTTQWVEDSGARFVTGPGPQLISFRYPFDGVPYTQVSIETDNTTATLRAYTVHIRGLTASSFNAVPMQLTTGSILTTSFVTVHWRSVGTRTFSTTADSGI